MFLPVQIRVTGCGITRVAMDTLLERGCHGYIIERCA